MIVRTNNQPKQLQDVDVMLCWLNPEEPKFRKKYTLKHTSNEVKTMIKDIRYKLDINTLHRNEDDKEIKMNDVCRVLLRTTKPLMADTYRKNRNTGSLILIDESTNETVAAGMII